MDTVLSISPAPRPIVFPRLPRDAQKDAALCRAHVFTFFVALDFSTVLRQYLADHASDDPAPWAGAFVALLLTERTLRRAAWQLVRLDERREPWAYEILCTYGLAD